MKTKKLIILCVCALALAACGGDDGPINIHGGGGNSSISDDKSENTNKNTSGPIAAQTRYEFPKTKGGTSEVIVHECLLNSSSKETGVNYCLEWDHSKRATRWVCYQMYQSVRASNWNRNNWPNGDPWAYDPLVPEDEQQNTYNELSKTTPPLPNSTYYQKGHILPSADRLCSQDANGQTYYMTNIYPQVGDFNTGIWMTMESRVRTWADQSDTLYVCKGGTIDDSKNILGYTMPSYGGHTGNHIVPKYFFTALLSKKGSKLKALGFWAEHKDGSSWGALKEYICSVDELEEKTGIDFFCNLPDDTEKTVESTLNLSDWNLK